MRKIEKPTCPNLRGLAKNYRDPASKNALIEASFGKCMYCESKVTHVYFGDVEHIKPKVKYPELEFDWSNLGFVCAKCNNAKSDNFEEATPYIDPYQEEPGDFLVSSGAFIWHKRGSERAELTIMDIQLNRAELVDRRNEKLLSIESAIDACFRTKNERLRDAALQSIKTEGESDREFSFVVAALLAQHSI